MDNKYQVFAEEILNMTKERKIQWKYLDSNIELYEEMNWVNTETKMIHFAQIKENLIPNFIENKSFYAKLNNTYIVLLVRKDLPPSLYIVPYTYKNAIRMSSDDFGEIITRLLNYVISQFPTADEFIDDVVSKISKE